MSAERNRLLMQGAPGSPYTRKMLAVLRYKHIEYSYINRVQAQAGRYADTAGLFQALGGGWWNWRSADGKMRLHAKPESSAWDV